MSRLDPVFAPVSKYLPFKFTFFKLYPVVQNHSSNMDVVLYIAEELVWKFTTKLNTNETTCNLCETNFQTYLTTAMQIKDHSLEVHGKTKDVTDLVQFIENSTNLDNASKLDNANDLGKELAPTYQEVHDRKSLAWKFVAKSNKDDYRCNLCGTEFKIHRYTVTQIKDHILKDHGATKEGFAMKEFIETRYRLKYTNKLPKVQSCKKDNKHCKCCEKFELVCLECGFKGASEKSAKAHQKSCKNIVCEECGFQAGRKAMHWHVLRNHKGKILNCDQCNYTAKKPSAVKTHIRNVHEGFRINCDKCEKKFTQHSDLNNHLASTHNIQTDKLIKCSECDFSTTYRQHMTVHNKKNHEEGYSTQRTWSCKNCNKRFRNKILMLKHTNSLDKPCILAIPNK